MFTNCNSVDHADAEEEEQVIRQKYEINSHIRENQTMFKSLIALD